MFSLLLSGRLGELLAPRPDFDCEVSSLVKVRQKIGCCNNFIPNRQESTMITGWPFRGCSQVTQKSYRRDRFPKQTR